MDDMDDVLKELENDRNPVESFRKDDANRVEAVNKVLTILTAFTSVVCIFSVCLSGATILNKAIAVAGAVSLVLLLVSIRVLLHTVANSDEKPRRKADNTQKGE